MDNWTALDSIAQNFVQSMREARRSDDWDEQRYVRQEMVRISKELRDIVKAVDVLNRHGIDV